MRRRSTYLQSIAGCDMGRPKPSAVVTRRLGSSVDVAEVVVDLDTHLPSLFSLASNHSVSTVPSSL